MNDNQNEAQFKDLLLKLGMEPYSTPVSDDETLVVLARMNGKTAGQLKNIESRLLYYIEKLLALSAEPDKPYKVRLSRPFILKDNTLRYTWDFTLKGDIGAAVADAQSIRIPAINEPREQVVSTQTVAPSKGSVRPVVVGSSRK